MSFQGPPSPHPVSNPGLTLQEGRAADFRLSSLELCVPDGKPEEFKHEFLDVWPVWPVLASDKGGKRE